jgi:CRP/FNR family cyclic AMP-dependent transcriptional regulator
MAEGGSGSIRLLDADPELARGVDPKTAREAAARLRVRVFAIPRGSWRPGQALVGGGTQPIGLLMLEGLLVREATVGDHPSAELLEIGRASCRERV